MTSDATSMTGSTALRLVGGEALGVLHRISTNVLLDLPVGESRPTLFCDFRGRLLHRAVVAHAYDGAVWLLRDDAPGAELAAFVDRHIFREAVTIDDRSQELEPGNDAGGFAWAPRLPEAGRIARGLPRHGHEIRDEFTPYEVNLWSEVHLDKGCYTGQEALMRLVTYDSVRRRLVLLGGEGPAPEAPGDVLAGGATVGRVTSVHATAGSWRALAVVKRDASGAWTTGGAAVLTNEPFPEARPLGRP